MNIKKYYKKVLNHNCIECQEFIRLEQILNKDAIMSITKQGQINLIHKKCIEKR